jgi:hypothetical protein
MRKSRGLGRISAIGRDDMGSDDGRNRKVRVGLFLELG